MQKLELLMPAGNLEKMEYAFAFGADAVYLGVPYFSLRARENEFDPEALRLGVARARAMGKKVYITANIFARNRKLKSFDHALDEWMKVEADAFIMSDPGFIMMAREKYPDINIHLSVQANCMNWESVRFWQRSLGVSRIILSRELSLREIKEIRDHVPDIELEAFVHGSICIAYSGRCLLSSYMSNRDANQGVCDNTCREKFKITEREFEIEDPRAKGESYPIEEDEEGTYILNAKDLCLIDSLQEMRDAGVCSFKVEGRTKSVYYAAVIARAYRRAIDDLEAGRPFDPRLLEDVQKAASRGYHKGFLNGAPGPEGQNYSHTERRVSNRLFAGLVKGDRGDDGFLQVDVRGTIRPGMQLEILTTDFAEHHFTVQEILNANRRPVEAAHPGIGMYWIKTNEGSFRNGVVNVVQG